MSSHWELSHSDFVVSSVLVSSVLHVHFRKDGSQDRLLAAISGAVSLILPHKLATVRTIYLTISANYLASSVGPGRLVLYTTTTTVGCRRVPCLAWQSSRLAMQVASSLVMHAMTSLFIVSIKFNVEDGRPRHLCPWLLTSVPIGSQMRSSPVRPPCLRQCPARPILLKATLSLTLGTWFR